MMKTSARAALLALLFVAAARPAAAEIRSQRIWLELSKAVAVKGGGYQLVQVIGNTSDLPLWLAVRQGACEKVAKIEAKQNATFSCEVSNLKPGRVPVIVTVFADEARNEILESDADEMTFSLSDIRKILAAAAPDAATALTVRTVSFDNIAFSEKLGVGSTLLYFTDRARGTLAISPSALEYVSGKRTLTIPVSSVHEVTLWGPGDKPWVVVFYEEAGQAKRAGFLAVRDPEDGPRIASAISAAMLDAIEPVAGETLADRKLQNNTRAVILDFEKVTAPGCTAAKIVDTKIEDRPSNGAWSERWLVDRCGKEVTYTVGYKPDPNGGTFVAITRPVNP